MMTETVIIKEFISLFVAISLKRQPLFWTAQFLLFDFLKMYFRDSTLKFGVFWQYGVRNNSYRKQIPSTRNLNPPL